MQREVFPPRKRWSLSTIKSQRSTAWMQSTASYSSSMEACTTPITPRSVVSMRRTELRKKALQGKACSAIHTVKMRLMSIIIPMHNCLQKLQNLKKLTKNSSVLTETISMIVTVTAKTLTHPEVMGTVALGN